MTELPPPPSTTTPVPARIRNGLATAAFVVAVGGFAVGLLLGIAASAVLAAGGFAVYTLLMGVVAFLQAAAAITAVVLALVALQRPGGRILIGAALGVAGTGLLSIVSGLAQSMVLELL